MRALEEHMPDLVGAKIIAIRQGFKDKRRKARKKALLIAFPFRE